MSDRPTGANRNAGTLNYEGMTKAPRVDSSGRLQWRPQRAVASSLALACAASVLAACSDGGGTGGPAVEYHPVGGVSENMHAERPSARLNLDHTVVTWLEAANGHERDVGSNDGVDEFRYHFEQPTQIRLSLDRSDESPQLVALDGSGNEIARVTAESGDQTITLSGETTLRVVHPHAGDPTAPPIALFLQPIRPDAVEPAAAGVAAGANPTDVATLKASKNCPFCNFAGMSWNACPGGATVAAVDLSHADFTGANLACVTFQGRGGDVEGFMLLTAAIFDNASLNEVTLSDVELTDARFSGTMFEITVFDGAIVQSADFSNSRWSNSVFGLRHTGLGSIDAQTANFQGMQFGPGSCMTVGELRGADFSGASFDSSSSVQGTQFGGANLFDVTFDGTYFRDDPSLQNCGEPDTANLGCAFFNEVAFCVRNQGPATVSTPGVCQRPTVPATAKGVTVRNADLRGVNFAGADLTNSVFASNMLDQTTGFGGAILAGVDFTAEHLGRSVDLSGALLSDTTNFAGAVLSDFPTSQQGVNLSCVVNGQTETGGCHFPVGSTQFNGASMQYAQLTNAGFTEVSLEGAMLDGANLVGAKLSFASLKGASLVGAHLGVDPGMQGAAVLSNAYMINVDLTDADMRSVDLTAAHVYGTATDALFVRALLDSAVFTNAILAGAVFTNARLPNAVFNGAQLVDAKFDGATLSNAKFDGAYLQGADFSSARAVNGMVLTNAAVSTMLTSRTCTLIPPGSWMYMDQDGVPYTFAFGETQLQTDASVTCPDGTAGPCTTGSRCSTSTTCDALCPIMSGPFPPIPPCVPSAQYCYENCLDPPCFTDIPDSNTHLCPLTSSCG